MDEHGGCQPPAQKISSYGAVDAIVTWMCVSGDDVRCWRWMRWAGFDETRQDGEGWLAASVGRWVHFSWCELYVCPDEMLPVSWLTFSVSCMLRWVRDGSCVMMMMTCIVGVQRTLLLNNLRLSCLLHGVSNSLACRARLTLQPMPLCYTYISNEQNLW